WNVGLDATSIRDRAMLGWKDWQILSWLARERWTLCTANGEEWERRAERWCAQGEMHHGILIVSQDWGTEGIIRAVQSYLATEAPDSLPNEVVRVSPPECSSGEPHG